MQYLLWDFDNTLAHRPGLWSQCLADTANLALPGARLMREQFARYLSSGFPWHTPEREHLHLSDPDAWWADLFPLFAKAISAVTGVDTACASRIAAQSRAEYLNPVRWVVFSDAEPTLTTLTRRGWRHIILSNHVPELPQLVEELGLAPYFEAVFTSGTLGYEKPHPLAFKAAIDVIPSNSRIVMIGDNFEVDYKGAQAVGLDAILVRGSHPECEKSSPDLFSLEGHLSN